MAKKVTKKSVPSKKKPAAASRAKKAGPSKSAAKPAGKSPAKSKAKPVRKPTAKPSGKAVGKASGKPVGKSPGVKKPKPAPAAEAPVPLQPPVPPRPTTKTPLDQARAFAVESARLLSDDKCSDIVVLDVSKLNANSDFIVIGTGTSDRQMRSTLNDVADLGATMGHNLYTRSVDDRATWVLADFVNVIVHLFEPNTRAYYDLEMMWGDAPKVAWERAPGDVPPPRNRRVVVPSGVATQEPAADSPEE
jgi:ribosome-associated protein